MFEEGCVKMKLNEPGRQQLERQNCGADKEYRAVFSRKELLTALLSILSRSNSMSASTVPLETEGGGGGGETSLGTFQMPVLL